MKPLLLLSLLIVILLPFRRRGGVDTSRICGTVEEEKSLLEGLYADRKLTEEGF